jgi:hypothetical protein
MAEESPPPLTSLPAELRERIAAATAASRTIALTGQDLANADVRKLLPELLEQAVGDRAPVSSPQLPGYVVLGEIGHGGMSTVYLARHEALGRHVALKIVPHWVGGQAHARERQLREARTMAKLSHPNIVMVHDIVEFGDTVAIAMEYIDGLSLAAVLHTLPEHASDEDMIVLRTCLGTAGQGLETTVTRTFVRMMAQVARAVHCVHQNGLLHLDVKPSNVLVRRDGTPLLADFGVVREIDLVLTHTRSFAGTPIYAAPEQLRRDDAAFGPHTDVYGLGITLYELLARSQPLRQQGLTRVLQDIQSGRIPRLSTRAEVSSDLENIVHKAISPTPERRYESAAAFADDLQAFLDGRPVAARPVTGIERLGRWIAAEPWKAAVGAVLLVLLPISAGLGLKLLAELPTIRASELQQRRERHAELAQIGLQTLLVANDAWPQQIDQLETAWREDPHDHQTLACLITLQAHDRPDAAIRTIDAAIAHGCRAEGLTMRRERLMQGLRFFTDAQVARLRTSNDGVDRLLLILDRILHEIATDQSTPLEDLLQTVNRAAMEKGPDPLLHGLRSWIAGHAGDRAALDESRDVMLATWPQNGFVLSWQAYARDEVDKADAIRFATEQLATLPVGSHAERAMRMALLRNLVTAEKWAAVLDATEGLDLADPALVAFANTRALALATLGRKEEAEALLVPPDPRHRCADPRWLRVQSAIDPVRGRQHYERVLADPRPPLVVLESAFFFAGQQRDRDFVAAVSRVGLRCYPEIELFRWGLAGTLWGRWGLRDVAPPDKDRLDAEAWGLVEGHPIPQARIEFYAFHAARNLATRKRWQQLLDLCDLWLRRLPHGASPHQVHYYRGIARLRLGEREGAWESLVRHAETAPQERQVYGDSYFERAYLSVDPSLPASSRNVAQAVGLLGKTAADRRKTEVQAYEGPKANPWFALMVAEVHFAEGDHPEARRLLEIAKRLRASGATWMTEPGDLDARLTDADGRYPR